MPQDIQIENGGAMREVDKSMYYIVEPQSFGYNPARINVGSIGYFDGKKLLIISFCMKFLRLLQKWMIDFMALI